MDWPPIADECPAVSYKVTVHQRSTYFTVDACLMHRMPDGSLREGWVPFDDMSVYVGEPNWLFRLLGDSTERRIARAKAKVAQLAERELARRKRLDAVMMKVATNA